MNARQAMIVTTALLSGAILWFPAGDTAQAAAPAWSPPQGLCNFGCGCGVSLGSEMEETTTPACYDETTMTILSSMAGCCAGCDEAEDCSWTVRISVTNTVGEDECCYEILKDGSEIFANSCTDSFNHPDSDTAPCDSSHLYVLRGEGAACPHSSMASCLTLMGNVKLWEQRVHCNASGINCP
jgi:hypothetical protein